jgi:hypothetical protein
MKKQWLDPSRNSGFIRTKSFYGKDPPVTDLPGPSCFLPVSSKNQDIYFGLQQSEQFLKIIVQKLVHMEMTGHMPFLHQC